MDRPQAFVLTASLAKNKLVPPLIRTESGLGKGTSEAQFTTRLEGQVNSGGRIMVSVAQFVTVLPSQNPLTSTQYSPTFPAVALVMVMKRSVAQLSNSPSFRHTKVKGPSPAGSVVNLGDSPKHASWFVKVELTLELAETLMLQDAEPVPEVIVQ
jgi:hypothetical protein